MFPLGVGADEVQVSVEFDGAGTFGLGGGGNACGCTDATAINYDETAQYDDGSCEFEVLALHGQMACNYDMNANTDDGSVLVCATAIVRFSHDGRRRHCNGRGAIYECGCSDIPAGDCDCDGNQEDALGVCGGDCTADADADGICDDVDDCVGAFDACGVCNGPGEIYECGCSAASQPATATATATKKTPLGECGGDCSA